MSNDASRSPDGLGDLMRVRDQMEAALMTLDRLNETLLAALLAEPLHRLDKRISSIISDAA